MDNNSLYIESKSYLMELISREMRFLSGKIRTAMGDHNNYAVFINEVNDIFYGKSFSQIKGMIKEYKDHFPKKSYADYNFFDLDTLNSYLEYIRELNYTIDELARKNNRQLTSRVYSNAIMTNAAKYSARNNKENTKAPALELDENGKPAPSRLRGKWQQNKVWQYQRYIRDRKIPANISKPARDLSDQQIKFNFNAPVGEDQVDEKNEHKEQSYISTTNRERFVDYKYKGKMYRLKVEEENVYVDAQGNPVSVIKASSIDGTLFMATDLNGDVYTGDLFEEETFDLVLTAMDTGEIFYSKHKHSTKKKPIKEENENIQIQIDESEII